MNAYDLVVNVIKENENAVYESLNAVEFWSNHFVELVRHVEVVVHLKMIDTQVKEVCLKNDQIKKTISILIPNSIKVKLGKINYEVVLSVIGIVEKENSIKKVLIGGRVFFSKGNKIWELGNVVVHESILPPHVRDKALQVLNKVAEKVL